MFGREALHPVFLGAWCLQEMQSASGSSPYAGEKAGLVLRRLLPRVFVRKEGFAELSH
jgi:hypothetical protein